ncbi:MAG: hydantoinase B/oxoprolinase family protein [Anaerolineae bacterium]|nr:MAG: hydantoinase B/oxoprolinase family protein [Anaerolineae bacterium]
MNAATLSIFRHLFDSIAEEMGVTLGRAAYSANIKERLDFSCAVFLGDGRILAQAAHIPVHLGAMPASVQAAICHCSPFKPGDVVILNDPYAGGTHLPDITLVSPAFIDQGANREERGQEDYPGNSYDNSADNTPQFFVASRAHHADIGGISPGSMPISTELFQEGLVIPPLKLIESGKVNDALMSLILKNVRTPEERQGDLAAQIAAHQTGDRRLKEISERYGLSECLSQAENLIDYAKRMTLAAIAKIPAGLYEFTDFLDDDGINDQPIPVQVEIKVDPSGMILDFSGTGPAVAGNVNAVPAIVISAAAYCIRCLSLALLDDDLPMNQGAYEPWKVIIEPGSLLDPFPPHAVAAGNVETSQRIVDVIFGALSAALPELVPAASQGTMNNVAFGSRAQSMDSEKKAERNQKRTDSNIFAYYETLGGGIGASQQQNGGDGMHAHMSNTLNTPVEALEYQFPVRIHEYRLRSNSGGAGIHNGGEGLSRAIEFLVPATATIVSDRRRFPPFGINGGQPGERGCNWLIRKGKKIQLGGKVKLDLEKGDQILIETPGGGGWGKR